MSEYVLRTARFKTISFGEEFEIIVKLCEKDKGVKDYMLSPQGTFWVESNGWKSELFKTRKKADYVFESKCLEFFVYEELFKMPDRKSVDELEDLSSYHVATGGNFDYFKPETKDFLYSCNFSEIHSNSFEHQVQTICKAIGKTISFTKQNDELFNALVWEIRPNSANLYKTKILYDITRKSYSKYEIEGNKELIYTYPCYKDLLMSCILYNRPNLPNTLSWLDD